MDNPSEYLVLLIDPACLDTHSSSAKTSALAYAETLSNSSSQSYSSSASSSSSSSNTSPAPASTHLLPTRRSHRPSRSKSNSTSASRSRSASRSSEGSSHLSSLLQHVGLKVLTAASFETALTLLEHRSANDARPMLLLVDVDTDLEISAPFPSGGVRSRPHSRNASYRGGNVRDAVSADTTVVSTATHKSHHGNNRQHNTSALRAPSDGAVTKGSSQRAHNRTQQKSPKQNGLSEHLTGLEFLEGVLQGLAKGTLHHIVPVAMSSTTSQDKVLELFNLGVADVLLKPIEEQVVRTLFLNVHRYGKYRTAITIPRYNTQKNNLSFPSHARLRSVFLKDQWLSDILVSHYCPTPTKISIHDFPSMSSYAAMERVVELKRRLLSWDFHPHDLCQDDLMRCVVVVIQEVMKLDGLGDLNIPDHLLHRFVIGLRDSYHRSNPYHNFAHAVDVLQATFYFLCRMGLLPETGCGYPPISGSDNNRTTAKSETNVEMGGVESKANIPNGGEASTAAARPTEDSCPLPQIRVQDFLRPEDIFALIVASIGHDVGHPGVNNMFLVNAHTPLAQVYNDRSVLESFHSMALFQVMKKHGFECFDVDSQNRKFMEFRKMVVSTILATDMGLHFDYVTKIKEQTERIRLRNFHKEAIPVAKQASIDEQERLVLCGTLIKCADISNASRPFHVAERWSAVLLQEMCNQADIEKEMANCSGNQPVPAGPTKDLASDPGMQIDTQLGFIHGFAMPLFASVKDIIPEMGYCVDMLHINHQIWKDRKAEFIKTGTGAPLSAVLAQPMLSNQNRLKSVEEPERATGSSSSRPSTPSRKSNSSGQSHLRTKAHSGKNSNHSTGGRGHAGASGHDEKESLNSSIVSPKAGEAAGNARNHQRSTSGIVPPSSRPHSISGSNHSNNYNSQARHAANSNLNANTSSGSAPSESSSVNGNAASSGLPRPRLRAKALTSEGNVPTLSRQGQQQQQRSTPPTSGSSPSQSQSRPPKGSSGARSRTVSSNSNLAIPSTLPVSPKSSLKAAPANQQSPPPPPPPQLQYSTSKLPSARGQRSPGRRSQAQQPHEGIVPEAGSLLEISGSNRGGNDGNRGDEGNSTRQGHEQVQDQGQQGQEQKAVKSQAPDATLSTFSEEGSQTPGNDNNNSDRSPVKMPEPIVLESKLAVPVSPLPVTATSAATSTATATSLPRTITTTSSCNSLSIQSDYSYQVNGSETSSIPSSPSLSATLPSTPSPTTHEHDLGSVGGGGGGATATVTSKGVSLSTTESPQKLIAPIETATAESPMSLSSTQASL